MQYVISKSEARALAALSKLAGKEKTRPMLQCVHVVVDDGRLRAYVTDSYRLARSEVAKAQGGAEDGSATVDARALAAAVNGVALAQLKTVEGEAGRALRVTSAGGPATELREAEGRYPDCERLLEYDSEALEAGWANVAYLADICAVVKQAVGPKAPTSIKTHASSAWHIHADDWERGASLDAILMPVRR